MKKRDRRIKGGVGVAMKKRDRRSEGGTWWGNEEEG